MRDPKRLKHRSWEVTEGPERAPARAMMRGMGLSDADLARPLVGVSNTWNESTPCQLNLDRVARRVKAGIRDAGGTPREFMTITVSDGIAMGHEGMRASLVSREVIADSIELMMHAHRYDALVACAACDKSIPGSIMAMGRFSGATRGLMVGHISPEAWDGGALATVRDGDMIIIDVPRRSLTAELTDAEIQARLRSWNRPAARYPTGALAKYAKLVGSASRGANCG